MRFLLPVLCLLAALPCLADDTDFAHIGLRELRENPTSFKNTRVAFKCRVNKTENLYAPFHTPFTAESHLQVSVWAPESRVFVAKERLDFFPNLFARRNRDWIAAFLEVPRYSWIYVWGEVKSDFGGEPWIEVFDFQRLSDRHFTDASLGATIRGYEAFEAMDLEGALAELASVSDYELPRTDRYHVARMKALAAWSLGRDADARREAARALRVRPGDVELKAIAAGTAPRAIDGEGEKTEAPREGEPGKKETDASGEGEKGSK